MGPAGDAPLSFMPPFATSLECHDSTSQQESCSSTCCPGLWIVLPQVIPPLCSAHTHMCDMALPALVVVASVCPLLHSAVVWTLFAVGSRGLLGCLCCQWLSQ